jgi:hypothetical protein
VRNEFMEKGKYLFLENRDRMYLVDTKLGYPRFFRDIFAGLLGAEARADWQRAREDGELTAQFNKDISALTEKWKKHYS